MYFIAKKITKKIKDILVGWALERNVFLFVKINYIRLQNNVRSPQGNYMNFISVFVWIDALLQFILKEKY